MYRSSGCGRDAQRAGDVPYLAEVEGKDNLFPDVDYRLYCVEAGRRASALRTQPAEPVW